MSRYSTYGPTDSPPLEEGDLGFVGVNDFDIRENLQPGQCQAATNMDFAQSTAATRGGFVCLPSLARSPFGQAWELETAAAANTWTGLAFGNNLFVAVSNSGTGNRVMTSPDGITWASRTSAADNNWNSVCFGNNLFVAVASSGTGNRVMTSPDGITWTIRTSAADNSWTSVTFGEGLFVAVASTGTGNRVMTSPDGIAWTIRVSAGDFEWGSVFHGNDVFVAVAQSAGSKIMSSPDGITWTVRTTTLAASLRKVTFGNNLFVIVSDATTSSNVATSPDGITWTTRTGAGNGNWIGVVYGAGIFTAVGEIGTYRAMVSPDGINWTGISNVPAPGGEKVIFGNNRFVAINSSGVIGTSVMVATAGTILASGIYSDPNSPASEWMVLASARSAGFFAFGLSSRTIAYPANYIISNQATIVQANNILFIFPGEGLTPIQWDGNWAGAFVTVPASSGGPGFESIPQSNQATYYQNRLWVVNGKDHVAASDVLDFSNYDVIANDFNLNTGSADYVVCTYPFGDNGLVVFKHKSSILLQNVQGGLTDVTATEITRQLGIIGINAVTTVGPDLIYVSDRNITSIRLNLQNQLQSVTEPLSRNIKGIIARVNWQYAYNVSAAYWDNKLFVALPLDNSATINSIVVYNFITQQWWGEWTFADALNLDIQGFLVANYLGAIRLHCVGRDGRIFVTYEGQNDISGTTVCEITASITTRAYRSDNTNRISRRMYADIGTNRPNFTIEAFTEGASESSEILSNQTYSRDQSWLFNDAPYAMNNSNDDYNRAFRKDYSTGPNSIQSGSGFLPEMLQDYRCPVIVRQKGRLNWFKITNAQGRIVLNGVGVESRAGDRSNYVQV